LKLAWLTDPHLDHADEWRRLELAQSCAETSDACVITGDVTSGRELQLLAEWATDYGKSTYFVLGNHDYWGGSFASVKAEVRNWCLRKSNLIWLDDSGPIRVAPGVQLCGVGGWYDAQFGDPAAGGFIMNDWIKTDDLRPHYYQGTLVEKCRALGIDSAMKATATLCGTDCDRILFATHVPPFVESAWHNGQPSEPPYLPWYTNKAMGLALNRFAKARPSVRLTTLCGHVHSASTFEALPNHTVLTGASEYGAPAVERVFDV
jgi:hypothetical protein